MYIWAADTHFDSAIVKPEQIGSAWALKYPEAKALLMTGDIANSDSLHDTLISLQKGLGKPIYFVLGNHDYWGSSFNKVDSGVSRLPNYIHHLTCSPIIDGDVGIVGVDGWYDAGYADPPDFEMNDFHKIEDLLQNPVAKSKERANYLANILGNYIDNLTREGIKKILVVTHVPPFECLALEADFIAWYGSKATGDILREKSKALPNTKILVICGHTHFCAECREGNIVAYSGNAQRGIPVLAGTFNEATFAISSSSSSSSSSLHTYSLPGA